MTDLETDEDEGNCDGCGFPTYGDGRYSDDDVFLCAECFADVPVTLDGEDRGLRLVKKRRPPAVEDRTP